MKTCVPGNTNLSLPSNLSTGSIMPFSDLFLSACGYATSSGVIRVDTKPTSSPVLEATNACRIPTTIFASISCVTNKPVAESQHRLPSASSPYFHRLSPSNQPLPTAHPRFVRIKQLLVKRTRCRVVLLTNGRRFWGRNCRPRRRQTPIIASRPLAHQFPRLFRINQLLD